MIPISNLVPGVRPDADLLVYFVQSDSRPSLWHRVDLACYSGHGACTCEHFQFNLNARIKKAPVPTEKMECPHIRQARRYFAVQMAQAMIQQRTGQKNPVLSREEWGTSPF